jgi:hypothetical protein
VNLCSPFRRVAALLRLIVLLAVVLLTVSLGAGCVLISAPRTVTGASEAQLRAIRAYRESMIALHEAAVQDYEDFWFRVVGPDATGDELTQAVDRFRQMRERRQEADDQYLKAIGLGQAIHDYAQSLNFFEKETP